MPGASKQVVGAEDARLAGVLACCLRTPGTYARTSFRTIIGRGPMNGVGSQELDAAYAAPLRERS